MLFHTNRTVITPDNYPRNAIPGQSFDHSLGQRHPDNFNQILTLLGWSECDSHIIPCIHSSPWEPVFIHSLTSGYLEPAEVTDSTFLLSPWMKYRNDRHAPSPPMGGSSGETRVLGPVLPLEPSVFICRCQPDHVRV